MADQRITVAGVVEKASEPTLTWQEVMDKTQDYLTVQAKEKAPEVGSTYGEWLVLGLARAGVSADGVSADKDFFGAYYQNVVGYVTQKMDEETGRLTGSVATDYARMILALSALGKDVTNVGGYDLLQGLSDTDYVKRQGINGPIWALIALDSGKYDIPTNSDSGNQVTREWLIDQIVNAQGNDGKWPIMDDMTGMAVQALAPYYSNPDVKAAVDKAIPAMKKMLETGSSETMAQIVVALSTLDMYCGAEALVADGTSSAWNQLLDDALAKLLSFAKTDGSFSHASNADANQMATEQAFYALVAYDRFKDREDTLYDMTDVVPARYTVTVAAADHGTVTANRATSAAGAPVDLTVTPDTGYVLESLTVTAGGNAVSVSENRFTMPAANVTVTPVFAEGEAEVIEVTGIILNKSTATFEIGKNLTLTAEVAPANATDKTVTWSSSDSTVAMVSQNGKITGVGEGLALITATAGGKTASCIVSVTAPLAGELDFGLTESQIKGYVTVSFEDNGQRVSGESMDAIYKKPLGSIIPATQVPYTTGDTIASVTLRLLDAMDFTASYEGSQTSGFYLEAIGNFIHNNTYYRSFGEFDAGVGSGWMITWNNWFIDKGASDFAVKNGDVIRWQYTCQLGADIGEDMSGEVYGVKALIDAIGTVTKDSGPAIQAARAAYDKLTNPQKALVTNYNKLTAAEKAYADLLAQEEIPDETAHPFSDAVDHWAEEAITYVYEKGLMTGTKADRFSPETELSRAMLVTILYRMEGEPAVTVDNTFSDVKDGTWYTDAVIWAAEKGIVNGVGKHRFAPNQDITREQMATMLLRYSDYKDYDTTQRNDLSDYADVDRISGWALEALQWANGEGLITGRKATILAPQGDTTRAETATILMRYLETIL